MSAVRLGVRFASIRPKDFNGFSGISAVLLTTTLWPLLPHLLDGRQRGGRP